MISIAPRTIGLGPLPIRPAACGWHGATVGYAHSGPADGEAERVGELYAVYLVPSAQGLGVGRLLVADALAALTTAGYVECILWVADQNSHARGFYRHLGFRHDGGRDVWRGLPVFRYRRALPATPP